MKRIISLDFDGGFHLYRNTAVSVNLPAMVAPSGIASERRNRLAAKLNHDCAGRGIRFAIGRNDAADSTIHIGKTTAFNAFGRFCGLAEGIGAGDAYVLLDDSASDAELLEVIRHEAEHILGTLDHGGARLERYAYTHKTEYHTGKKLWGNSEFLGSRYTVNVTFREVTPPSDVEHLTLSYGENHTTIEEYYWS